MMEYMGKLVCCMLMITCGFVPATAQRFTVDNITQFDGGASTKYSSRKANAVKYNNLVEGSPYFMDSYQPAALVLQNGQSLKAKAIKLNLLDNEIMYTDDQGEEMILIVPVKTLHITTNPVTGTETAFEWVAQNEWLEQPGAWLQVLGQKDDLTLYKRHRKELESNFPYGSATAEWRVKTSYQYLVQYRQQWQRIKKPEELAAMHPSRAAELQAFIKSQKLSSKNDSDWQRLVDMW